MLLPGPVQSQSWLNYFSFLIPLSLSFPKTQVVKSRQLEQPSRFFWQIQTVSGALWHWKPTLLNQNWD